MLKRGLEIYKTVLGLQHPQVAKSLNHLAELFCKQGRYEEAEPLYQSALEIRETLLGAQHPHVIVILRNYANLLMKVQRTEEAQSILKRIATIQTQETKENS